MTIAQTGGRMQGALENAKLKLVFGAGRQTAQALAPLLYLPKLDTIKHVVENADYQEQSHPLFESLMNQVEQAVQTIMTVLISQPD